MLSPWIIRTFTFPPLLVQRPGFDAPGVCQLFAVIAMSFACVLHFSMSSCAFHFAYVFVSCIRAFSPLSVLQSGTPMPSGVPLLSLVVSGC